MRYRSLICSAMVALLAAGCPSDEPVEEEPGEDTAEIVLPDAVEFSGEVGDDLEAAATFENSGDATLEVDVHLLDDAEWFDDVDPDEFGVDPGEQQDVQLSVSCLEAGDFETELVVLTNDPDAEELDWPVQLSCVEPEVGELTVNIEGLPEDVGADVTVSDGDDVAEPVTETSTLELRVGEYDVQALPAGDHRVFYDPDPEEQTVQIDEDDHVEVSIDHELVLGAVEVDLEGLPEDADPAIELLDDDGQLVDEFPQDGRIEQLEPGDYTVSPGNWEEEDVTYSANDYSVFVESDDTQQVTIDYVSDVGRVVFDVSGLDADDIEGLDEDVAHDMQLVHSENEEFTYPVPLTGELDAVEPGEYTLEVHPVHDGDDEEEALRHFEGDDVENIEVEAGGEYTVEVEYELIPGSLIIEVDGAPEQGEIVVDGPDQSVNEQHIVAGAAFNNVAPGIYTVTAEPVYGPLGKYEPIVVDEEGELLDDGEIGVASDTDMVARVVYEGVPGQVDVDVHGLDEGVGHDLELVRDSDGTSYEIPQTGKRDGVAPGVYTLQVNRIGDGDLRDFDGADIEDVVVETDEETVVTVNYGVVPGELTVEIEGTPVGGDVIVDGPDGAIDEQKIEQTHDFGEVEAGSYTLEVFDVEDEGRDAVYRAGDDSVGVASGADVTVTVGYSAILGELEVDVEWDELRDEYGEVEADIRVVGDGGEVDEQLDGPGVVKELYPGEYDVIIETVTDEDGIADYTGSSQQLDDGAILVGSKMEGEEPTSMTVDYDIVRGDLVVGVQSDHADWSEDNEWSATVVDRFDEEHDIEPRQAGETGIVEDVVPGEFIVTFDEVEHDGDVHRVYRAEPEQKQFASDDTDWEITGNYDIVSGQLEVAVEWEDDLDDYYGGLEANIEIEGEDEPLTESALLDLEPGEYDVTIHDVLSDGDVARFEGDAGELTEEGTIVVDSKTEEDEADEMTVDYSVVRGELVVDAEGNEDSDWSAKIDGPDADGRLPVTIADGDDKPYTFGEALPGDYTVEFDSINVDLDEQGDRQRIYEIDEPVEFSVASDDDDEAWSITGVYELIFGQLDVAIDWQDFDYEIYENVEAEVVLRGIDDGQDYTVTDPTGDTIGEVYPDEYVVDIEPASDNPESGESVAEFVGSSEDLDAGSIVVGSMTGDQSTSLTVDYEIETGEFDIVVGSDSEHFRDELEWNATVSGPAGFDDATEGETLTVTDSYTVEEALPAYEGDYTVEFEVITDEDADDDIRRVFEADAVSSSTAFRSGETENQIDGEYQLQAGELTVDMSGLPDVDGANEDVILGFRLETDDDSPEESFGYNGSQADQQAEITALEPGYYKVEEDGDNIDFWGNAFNVYELGEVFAVHSRDAQEVTHSLTADLPTEVLTDGDGDDYGTLREVVDRVVEYSEITFADGVDDITLTDGEIAIGTPISLFGDGVTVRAGHESRLFRVDLDEEFDGEEIRFHGLELREGEAEAGGAVDIDGGDVVFFDVDFIDNAATDEGGAIAALGELQLTINGGEFSENEGATGGAIFTASGANLVIDGEAQFEQNSASQGGAIVASGDLFANRIHVIDNDASDGGGAIYVDGDAELDEMHFAHNEATDGSGGAIYVSDSGSLTLSRALLEENDAPDGGAVYLEGDARVVNTTFSANGDAEATEREGGALWIDEDSETEILFSTFYGNRAEFGEAIWTNDAQDAVMKGSMVFNNGSDNQIQGPEGFDFVVGDGDGEPIASAGYNFVQDESGYFEADGDTDIEGDGTTNLDTLSKSEDEFTATHAIADESQDGHTDVPASACTDLEGNLLSSDQRGAARPSGAGCSRGAWEVESDYERFIDADFSDKQIVGAYLWNNNGGTEIGGDDAIDGTSVRFTTDNASIALDQPGASESVSLQAQAGPTATGDDTLELRLYSDGNEDSSVASISFAGDEEGVFVLEVDEEPADEFEIRNVSDGGGDIVIDNVSWR